MCGNWGVMVVVGFYDIVAYYLKSSSESRLIKSDRVIYASNPVCLKAKERNCFSRSIHVTDGPYLISIPISYI